MSRFVPSSSFMRMGRAAIVLAALAVLPGQTAARAAEVARVADAERIHALVIGIDAYRNVPRLRGAVADARDIAAALRKLGVEDIAVLLDEEADRAAILAAVAGLRSRVRPGDLVVLAVAGHGAQEPERVKGSDPDGKDVVFLLAGFDTASRATTQRILDMEFKHFIKELEAAGARVLFVADTCSGGGLARAVDPRGEALVYRAVPTYRITEDELKPVATPADALTTELDFERTIFLAAADRNTKAPEIKVEGVEGYRGALSYAVARALEGAADSNADGTIVAKELLDYVHQVTYQLSDQRQNIVTATAPALVTEPVVRAVTLVGAPRPAAERPEPPFVPASSGTPVRVAMLGGDAAKLAGVKPIATRFDVVALSERPDLIWDARTGDVISAGDIVARTVAASDLPSVVDRTAAVRTVKQIAAKAVQSIRLVPDSAIHHRGSRVEIEVDGLAGRSLLLFNIAGDGTVQLLYPTGNDPKMLDTSSIRLPIEVREPFGSDQVVAVTAARHQVELEKALARASDRRAAAQLVKRLAEAADAGLKVGSVGVFTAP